MLGNNSEDYQELEQIFTFENNQPDHTDLTEYRVFAAFIYSTLAVGGLIVNMIFCCVIWRTDKLHTVTHMLMTNLAVCNILFLMFHPPYFLTTFILESNWKFGTVICKASFSVGYVTVTGSFYFMCLVAIDRWLAIFYRRLRLDRRRCIYLTSGAWLLSVVVASPYIYKSQVLDMNSNFNFGDSLKTEMTRCGAKSTTWDDTALILTIIVQYVVPLAIMVPAYGHLSYFLWKRPPVGIQSKERAKKAYTRRRRLTITLIAIVAILVRFVTITYWDWLTVLIFLAALTWKKIFLAFMYFMLVSSVFCGHPPSLPSAGVISSLYRYLHDCPYRSSTTHEILNKLDFFCLFQSRALSYGLCKGYI
uniref:G_PROTEIN_RECEP_F1_2 domain-containing protein n=1 Tax=Heterorhabditis bacteriophora TaxID=37862 RepID=A0A1I7XEG0_HETBA